MGETDLTQHEVEVLVQRMSPRWRGDGYSVLSRNCCHFCDELCMSSSASLGRPSWPWAPCLTGSAASPARAPPSAAVIQRTRPRGRAGPPRWAAAAARRRSARLPERARAGLQRSRPSSDDSPRSRRGRCERALVGSPGALCPESDRSQRDVFQTKTPESSRPPGSARL
ncbi:unnamed protein product [Prorocentrum cordatum]|uniref:PPPDE domain-containing protein n=1 Tax=Prorocentrum cordatum TaxID=2364126 RepID=A0ABN9TQJ0_9DINO|nr:unnamed protein product [Polarella glacialis]